jgi:hypothetical protein
MARAFGLDCFDGPQRRYQTGEHMSDSYDDYECKIQLAEHAWEKRVVKTEHDRAVELGKAYERGWNAALAQQEPVAWITNGGKGELWWHRSSKFDEEGNLIGPNPDDIPLYTAPPKREWVGLTDDEMEALFLNEDGVRFARYIEAKLREKNHGH